MTWATVEPIPSGYQRVTPYLHVDGAAEAIQFYRDILGATERMRMSAPGNKIGHAELLFGETLVMLADEMPDMGMRGPKSLGGTPVTLYVYVEDVDTVFERATQAGATSLQAVEDRFYGDRVGSLEDPWGHHWEIASHIEDVSEAEMERRMAQMSG